MTIWTQLSAYKARRRRYKILACIFACLIFGSLISFCLIPKAAPSTTTNSPTILNQYRHPLQEIASVDAKPSGIVDSHLTELLPALERSPTLITLSDRNSEVVTQEYADVKFVQRTDRPRAVGPKRIRYVIAANGAVRDLSVGQASLQATNIPGAALEWRVSAWRQPGWLPTTSDCGNPGGIVGIAGHVSWYGNTPGPFSDLGALLEGDLIECQDRKGIWHTYMVLDRFQTNYHDTTYLQVNRNSPDESWMILFTCTTEVSGILVIQAIMVGDVTK